MGVILLWRVQRLDHWEMSTGKGYSLAVWESKTPAS